ncbi:MAG: hypothetical protein U0996_26395 [Planctomycetaceae bacterium]
MTDPPKALVTEIAEITHDEFRLESSLEKVEVVVPEPIDRLTPEFGAWLRAAVVYEAKVLARNPSSEPDEEGLRPLSQFRLRVLFWERPDGEFTIWLAYPVSAAAINNIKPVQPELLMAIWRELGVLKVQRSSHIGAGMRLLFPVKESTPDDAFDLYKALEEDELDEGLVFRKFPFSRATRIAEAHSGAIVAICDGQIFFMYGDYDEFDRLQIKFARTGSFHTAKSADVKSLDDFVNLIGKRQLQWLKNGKSK